MSAEVETMFNSMFVPWHGQGTVLEEYPDSRTAYRASGLDWKVRVGPTHDHIQRPIPGRVTIYRESDDTVLGLATDIYKPIQNRIMFDIGDAMFQDGRATYASAGSLLGGQKTWVLLRLPDDIIVNGRDRHECYLLITTGHDGKTGLTGWLTRVRVVCRNTLLDAMTGKAAFKVEHYGNTTGRLLEAAKAIRVTTAANARYGEWLNQLAATDVKAEQLDEIQMGIWGEWTADDESSGNPMKRNQIYRWREVLEAETAEFGLNAYTVLNSITAMGDHFIPVRSRPTGDQRMVAMLDGIIMDWKTRGLRVMSAKLGTPVMPSAEKAAVGA